MARQLFTARALLVAVTPAIQNPMLLLTLEQIGGKAAATPDRKDLPDEKVAEAKLYRGPNSEMGWPADNLMATLCNGGKHQKIKMPGSSRQSAITKSGGETQIPTIVTFTKQFFPFEGLDTNGNVPTEALSEEETEAIARSIAEKGEANNQPAKVPWVVHAGRTVNQQTGGSNRTVRPLIPKWSSWVEFTFKSDFAPETMAQLWRLAGEKSGLGDWRGSAPNKPGSYGQFRVAAFQISKVEPINDNIAITYVGEAKAFEPKADSNSTLSSPALEERVKRSRKPKVPAESVPEPVAETVGAPESDGAVTGSELAAQS